MSTFHLPREPTFDQILAFFREAQRRLHEENMTLAKFNSIANGHILGEGRLKELPFANFTGQVDKCVHDIVNVHNQARFQRHFCDNANVAGCLDQMIDVVESFFFVKMEPSELPLFVLRIVDEMLKSMQSHPRSTPAFTDRQLWMNKIQPELKRTPAHPDTDWDQILLDVHDHIDERIEHWIHSHPDRSQQVRSLRSELAQRNRLRCPSVHQATKRRRIHK